MMWPHPKPVTPGHSCVTTKPTSPKGVDMTENVREGGSKAMGVETGTVGPEGSERLTSGPDDALTIEANKWLHMCGSCDAGLTMNCTCPEGDYRSLIQRLDMARVALSAEVEDLKDALADMFDVRCERDATIEVLSDQIGKLAEVIMHEVSGEPSRSEGAVDTAIRIIRELTTEVRDKSRALNLLDAERAALAAEVERLKDLVCDREDSVIERDATIERLWAQLNEATNVPVAYESVCDECGGQS